MQLKERSLHYDEENRNAAKFMVGSLTLGWDHEPVHRFHYFNLTRDSNTWESVIVHETNLKKSP